MRRATVLLVALASSGTGVIACSGYEGGGDARIVPVGSSEGGADAADASVTDSGGRSDSAGPGPTPATLSVNLAVSYRFDEDADDSVTARNLSVVGPTPGALTFPPGVVNNAARLPNASHYLSVPTGDFALSLRAQDFTVQAWVRIDQVAPGSDIVLIGRSTSSEGWWLSLRASTGPTFRALQPSFEVAPSQPQAVTAGAWHHVVARRQSSKFDLHYDGVRVGTETIDATISLAANAPLVLGKELTGQTSPGARLLDEVAIWTRALTDSEVSQLYNGGAGRAVVPSAEP